MNPIQVRMIGVAATPGKAFEFDYIPTPGASWQTSMARLEELRLSMGALSFSVRQEVR